MFDLLNIDRVIRDPKAAELGLREFLTGVAVDLLDDALGRVLVDFFGAGRSHLLDFFAYVGLSTRRLALRCVLLSDRAWQFRINHIFQEHLPMDIFDPRNIVLGHAALDRLNFWRLQRLG